MYTPEKVEKMAEVIQTPTLATSIRRECAAMLRAYAATLKAAQGGVTEAMVERARLAIMASNGFEPGSDGYINDSAIRAALEAALSAQQGPGEALCQRNPAPNAAPAVGMTSTQHIVYLSPEGAAPPAQPADSKVIGADSQIKPERVPEGWVLVPREPTEAMLEAFFDGEMSLGRDGYVLPSSCWQAMLDATPAPSPARGDGGE